MQMMHAFNEEYIHGWMFIVGKKNIKKLIGVPKIPFQHQFFYYNNNNDNNNNNSMFDISIFMWTSQDIGASPQSHIFEKSRCHHMI